MKLYSHNSPWWCFILIFFISQISAALIPLFKQATQIPVLQGYGSTIIVGIFSANVLAILLFFVFRPSTITWSSTVAGLHGSKGRRTMLTLLMALPLMLLLNLGQEVFFPEIPDLVGEDTFRLIMKKPLGLLTVSILGPLSEELLFRGGVQTDMSKRYSHQGWQVPILFTALLFSIVHLNPAQMPLAFVLGLLLGFAYWWTGSLAASIGIHIFNNSFASLLTLLSPENDTLVHCLGGRTSAGLIAIVSVFWIYLVLRAIRKEGFKTI